MDQQVQGKGTITKPAKNAAKCQGTSAVMQLVVHNSHEELSPTNSLHNQLQVLQQHYHISNSSVSKMQISVTLSYLDEKIFHLGVLA